MRVDMSGLAVVTAVLGAALGLAGVATADTLEGPYSITVTNGRGVIADGAKQGVFTSPCGPDCVTFNAGNWTADMRLQNGTWSGVTSAGLTLSFDSATMAGTMVKPATNETLDVQVVKLGM